MFYKVFNLSLIYLMATAVNPQSYTSAFADTEPHSASLMAPPPCGSEDPGDCAMSDDCNNVCGCDRSVAYFYNETTGNCELSPNITNVMVEKYNNEEKIRLEAERIFSGVIAAAILFVTCAAIFMFGACIYCCRMGYTDQKLTKDVQALAKKQGRKLPPASPLRPKPAYPPVADSCSIVVEDAGVCVM